MSGNKKAVVIIVALLIVCCVLPFCAFFGLAAFAPDTLDEWGIDYNFDFDTTLDDDSSSDDTPREVEEGEITYENATFGFSLVMPEDWKASETGTQVVIDTASGSGSINFEAFEDPSFSTFDGIDQEFCDSFGEGFRSGLGVDEQTAAQFSFTLFTLNGNTGCRAEGSLFDGINQRYYVFFNNSNKQVYSIFYTSTSADNEDELAKVMDTFDF